MKDKTALTEFKEWFKSYRIDNTVMDKIEELIKKEKQYMEAIYQLGLKDGFDCMPNKLLK